MSKEENLEAVVVAEVMEEKRLIMYWRGQGDRKYQPCFPGYQRRASGGRCAVVEIPSEEGNPFEKSVVRAMSKAAWLEAAWAI